MTPMKRRARRPLVAFALAAACTGGIARADDATAKPPSGYVSRASSEVSGYGDTDHVFVVTPTIAGKVARPAAGWSLDARYLVDVVSAASVDIVSTASRRWEEIRHVGSIGGEYKPGAWGVAAHANVSSEPDYLSLSAGTQITHDFHDKNAAWLLGFDHARDVAGRTGTPFSIFSHAVDREAFKAGLTLVLDRATVASIVGDVVIESGDPSKPYRYIPMFAPGVDVPRGASIDLVTSLRTSARPLEQLPLTRDRFALSAGGAHRFTSSTLRVDERLYIDSWDLKATSTDARLLFDVSRRVMLGPHVRFHAQTPVSFWQRAYVLGPGVEVPALRAGDRELGPLLGFTGGGSMRLSLGPEDERDAAILGFDLNATSTQYFDDLYVTHRLSMLAGISLEVAL
jgi:hypothetical protein